MIIGNAMKWNTHIEWLIDFHFYFRMSIVHFVTYLYFTQSLKGQGQAGMERCQALDTCASFNWGVEYELSPIEEPVIKPEFCTLVGLHDKNIAK